MPTPPAKVEVAAAFPAHHTYTYAVPESLKKLVAVGKRVLIPFGTRRITGYILGPGHPTEQRNLKDILDVLDEVALFPPGMVPFFNWIADYYIHPIGEVIQCALPGGMNIYDVAVMEVSEKGRAALEHRHLDPLSRSVLSLLVAKPLTYRQIQRSLEVDFPRSLLFSLQRKGLISRIQKLKGGRTRPRTELRVRLVDAAKANLGRSQKRRKILALLEEKAEISLHDLRRQIIGAGPLVKDMAASGAVTLDEMRTYRDPFGDIVTPDSPPDLTEEQTGAVATLNGTLDSGFSPYVLAGVTGSGKTEVYLHLTANLLSQRKTVLILVPEIALISQMEHRFRARFGDRIAVLHSGLSPGERYDQWRRILEGRASIAMGARSAVFAPLSRLGMVIVDEEHDESYKQEGSLRYHARDLAVVRAKLDDCTVVLGSATPSIQSYHNVKTGKYSELKLHQRIQKRPLPDIKVVDLRRNRDQRGPRRYITPELHRAMDNALANNEQVLLFLNRRGFASFPVCGACGRSLLCRHCDITLTFHQAMQAYRCHYCGFSSPLSTPCPTCGSTKIKRLGLGTEKLEATIKSLFPDARVARMDRDTTTRKGSLLKILKELRDNEIDILIGTQMVAKGHDFPNITLVGVVCADLSLSFPDFRAGERTFQLLAQVAGRAGRGAAAGGVILQTYTPDHFSITTAREQDFRAFYDQEIGFRRMLNYPPFARLILLKISGPQTEPTRKRAETIARLCRTLLDKEPAFSEAVELLGPIEASLPKIARQYRWQILLKGRHLKRLHRFVETLFFQYPGHFKRRGVKVAVDVDPVFMM